MAYTDKAVPKAQSMLEPGEQIIALTRFQMKGVATGQALGGLAGMAIQNARTKGDRQAAEAAGLTLPNRGTIVITDRRIAVFSPTAFAGQPKKLVDSVPRATVVGAEPTGKGIAPALMRTRLHYANGGQSELDLFKRDGAEQFIAALNVR